MSQLVRIALDAMGGDHGPAVVVAGAELALARRPELDVPVLRQPRAGRAACGQASGAAIGLAGGPCRGRRAHGRQTEPGAAPRPAQILDVAGDRCGEEKRGRHGGIGGQHRRSDGDVEVRSENAGRYRAAGDRGVVADLARRIDRARCRRLDRRGRRASGGSRGHGRGHRPHPARARAADRRPSQYRRRGSQRSRAGPRSRPHSARTANARSRLCRLRRRRRHRRRQGRRRRHRGLRRQHRAQDRRRHRPPDQSNICALRCKARSAPGSVICSRVRAFANCASAWTHAASMAGCFSASTALSSRSHGGTDAEGFAAAIELGYDVVRDELLAKITAALARPRRGLTPALSGAAS